MDNDNNVNNANRGSAANQDIYSKKRKKRILTAVAIMPFAALLFFGSLSFSITSTTIGLAVDGSSTILIDNNNNHNNYQEQQKQEIIPEAWATTVPGPNGQIAFSNLRNGTEFNHEIYVMNADGSNQTRLTNNTEIIDFSPSWSPDGTKIAFDTTRHGHPEIYVMNAADGSNPTRLTNNTRASDSNPSWSPDGTKIAFNSDRDGNSEIYVMNAADGSNPTRLTTDGDSSAPDWGIGPVLSQPPTGTTTG